VESYAARVDLICLHAGDELGLLRLVRVVLRLAPRHELLRRQRVVLHLVVEVLRSNGSHTPRHQHDTSHRRVNSLALMQTAPTSSNNATPLDKPMTTHRQPYAVRPPAALKPSCATRFFGIRDDRRRVFGSEKLGL
jgi:hypothetical protein